MSSALSGRCEVDTLGYQRPVPGAPPASELTRTLPHLSVRECVHYTPSLDPDVALLGLSFPHEQDES